MSLVVVFSFAPILVIAQTFSRQYAISTSFAYRVYTGDFDGDGDNDVLTASLWPTNKVVWHENIDGKGTFGSENLLTTQFDAGGGISASDLDNDGNIDILGVEPLDFSAFWFKNMERGKFSGLMKMAEGNSILGHPNHIHAADLDGDNDLDVLIADNWPSAGILWIENENSQGEFNSIKFIANASQAKLASYVHAADIDNDGDIDVLSASKEDDKIAWYKNDGSGSFTQHNITTQADGATSVNVADIDEDGDIDVLSTSAEDNKIAWYENIDGKGKFSSPKIISNEMIRPLYVCTADINLDGAIDVIACSEHDNKIVWYKKTGGQGIFGAGQIIDSPGGGVSSIHAADLDNDGDMDILVSVRGKKTVWYKNLTITTPVEENEYKAPVEFNLLQNYPNPFNPSTTIHFILQKSEHISLKIYNLSGQEIKTLIYGERSAGQNQVQWQAKGLPSGIYFARLQAGGFSESKKLMLFR